MLSRLHAFFALSLVGSLAIGCGGSDDGGGDAAPPASTGSAGQSAAGGSGSGAGGDSSAGGSGTGTGAPDTGFRPKDNGFAFENYTNQQVKNNLTPAELQRMFGNGVCASMAGGTCTLTPAAEQWMQENNQGMDGGHCEGMAALSILLYAKKVDIATLGAANASELTLDNDALGREIAYFWATQGVSPTAEAEFGKEATPKDVVDKLREAMSSGVAGESYTMGIYKRGYKDGHAITPYAVEDAGNGVVNVRVYDNNFPGDERTLEVDTNNNTWKYTASTNPNEPASLYEGDADSKTLTITANSARLGQQVCPFCGGEGGTASPAPGGVMYNEVFLDGEADLLITDGKGNELGYKEGNFVSTIPGAGFIPRKSNDLFLDDPEPIYRIPADTAFSVKLDGTQLAENDQANITLVGRGYTLGVEGIMVEPMQVDTVSFSNSGTEVSYETQGGETPSIILGIETPAADYEFTVKAAGDMSGMKISLKLDDAMKRLVIQIAGATDYELTMERIDDNGAEFFSHAGVAITDKDIALLDYGSWNGQGSTAKLEIDEGGDGTVDQTVDLTDEN